MTLMEYQIYEYDMFIALSNVFVWQVRGEPISISWPLETE